MTPATLEREPITASEDERPGLARAEQIFDETGFSGDERRPRLVSGTGDEIELPEPLFRVLRQAVRHLLRGDSVAIAPVNQRLTTQQAADFLNVSRPYLVRLLESGEIPFTKTGTHRRVQLCDLAEYKRRRDTARRQHLRQLTQLNQELGLYSDRLGH
jgi:excisionase family DNA binding protein